ncbi:MAG: 4Fe-4S dicluster domain-containing protein, partial [Bacteroidales bacterium]
VGLLATGIAAKKIMSVKSNLDPDSAIALNNSKEMDPICPPGAGSLEAFKDHCTACHACIAACPNQIIRPAIMEYGIDGFMLPTIQYDKKFCAYDCNKCSQVCPHGALQPLTLEEKQLTQIGRAKYIPKNCIVFTDGTDCGACDEHCPTKAISMTEVKGKPGLFFPKLNRDICIGCGACEYICPASAKAIVIDGNPVQLRAQPPKVEKQQEKKVDDFGF